MTEKQLETLLARADFSRETDLKQRLRAQLFGATIKAFPQRVVLEDDELDQVYAAGDHVPGKPDDPMKK